MLRLMGFLVLFTSGCVVNDRAVIDDGIEMTCQERQIEEDFKDWMEKHSM